MIKYANKIKADYIKKLDALIAPALEKEAKPAKAPQKNGQEKIQKIR